MFDGFDKDLYQKYYASVIEIFLKKKQTFET
jgi:hypothetical protein